MADPVALDDVNTAIEDGAIVTGNVGTNDSDADLDTLTFALVGPAPAGLTFNPDGSYLFNPLNAAYQSLAQGATQNVVVTYIVNDGNGGTDTATLTITVTGTNDAPIAADDTATATEDGALSTGDVGDDDTDVDVGATRTYALAAPVDGLTLGTNGHYSFNPGHASYQHIAQGATQTVVATYVVTDQHGATDTATLTITVTGTNDAPVAAADNNSATEGGAVVTGNVGANDTDVDDGAVLTYSHGVLPAGLTINANGSYSFDPTNAAYDSLAVGDSQAVVANYVVTDQHGASSASTLTIVVQGSNDAAVITGDVTGSASETDAVLTVTGNLDVNDVDGADTFVPQTNTGGTYGAFSIDSDGDWSYVTNNAQNQFAQGQTYVDTFTVASADGTTQSVTITINGTNDAPVAGDDVNTATEDGSVVTGTVATNDSDVDTGATLSYALGAPVAGLTLNPNGSYSFDPSNAAYQSLAQGTSQNVVATYIVSDQHGATDTATLTITVTGANDAPVANDDIASATEGGATVTGNVGVNDTDVDASASLSYAPAGPLPAGLVFGPNGNYSFDPTDPTYNSLAQGATQNVAFNYTVSDGLGGSDTGTLTITVTGTNDAPVAVADTNTATEDGPAATGNVGTNDTDVDNGATLTYALNAPVAGLTLNPDGSYSFDPSNSAYQSLADGATQNVVANYTVTDQHSATSSSTLTITVTGANDAPVISGAVSGSASEAISLDGINGADQTANNRLEPAINYDATIVSLVGTHGTDMEAILDDLVALLPAGSGLPEAIAIVWDYVDDNFSYYNNPINIMGARLAIEYARYLEGGGQALTGVAAKYTPDGGDLGSAPDRYQSLHDNLLGNLNDFGLSDKLRGSPNGSNPSPDEAGYQAIIALLDTHDLEYLSTRPYYGGSEGETNLALADDQFHDLVPETSGQLTSNDPDSGASQTWSGSATGIYGTFAINSATGAWTYTLDQFDPQTQTLAQGVTALDTFTATVSDGLGGSDTQLVTITVTGTNDAPVAVADTASGTEGASPAVTGSVATNDSDVDSGAVLTYALSAPVAGLTLNPNGTYSFDQTNAAYNSLGDGVTQNVVATYTVADQHGASSSSTLTITMTGTNDAPVVSGPVLLSATEGGGVHTVNPLANSSDPDIGDSISVVQGSLPAGVTFVGSSSFTDFESYTPGSVVGQNGWTDGSPGSPDSVIVDLSGDNVLRLANDPTSGDFAGPYTPELSFSVGENGNGDTFSFSFAVKAVNSTADGSRIEIDLATSTQDDRYNFMALEYVAGGLRLVQNTPLSNGTDWQSNNFNFGTGNVQLGGLFDASVEHVITVIFKAVDGSNNDVVEYYVDGVLVGTGSSFENYNEFHVSGQTHATAVREVTGLIFRAGEPAGNPFLADGPGGNRQGFYIDDLRLASYDSQQLHFDANDPAYDHLAVGATQLVTVNYNVVDLNGGSTPASTVITVTGTNDAPVALADTASATEGAPAVNGSVATNDGDIDDGAVLSYAFTGIVPAGLTMTNSNGSYSFDPANAAYNSLGDGVTQNVVATYTVTDQHGLTDTETLTITITGTNDAPVVSGPVLLSATEGTGVHTVNPLANASDPDVGDSISVVPGSLPAGVTFVGSSWSTDFESYTPGTVVGQQGWTDASPGSPDSVIVDLSGDNVLRLANDPTSGDFGGPYTPELSFSVGENGNGDTFSFSFAVKAVNSIADGSRIEIDLATSTQDDRYNFMALEYVAGGLRLVQNTPTNTSGVWQSNNFDFGTGNVQLGALLNAAVEHVITVIFRPVDGANNDIVEYYVDGVLVGTGSSFENYNEYHVGQPHANAVREVTGLLFRAGDPAGNPFAADGPGGQRQGFYIDDLRLASYDSQQLHFDANDPAYDHLAAGVTQLVTVNYNVVDLNGGVTPASTVITVTGTNDAAVITGNTTGSTTETDAVLTVTGNLDVVDVDDGQSSFITQSNTDGTYGSFSIDSDGDWTYVTDNAQNQFAQGQTYIDTFTVASADGTTQSVTVTINGSNDAPVALDDTAAATEDGPVVTGNVGTNDSDVDTGATRTWALNAPVAGLTLNPNGSYIFNTLDPAYQSLGAGVTQNVVATYTVTDQHNATDTATLTITVTGTNDAPVANDDTAAATEDGAIVTGNVGDDDTDIDAGDTRSFTLNAPIDGLTLNPNGSYSFDPGSYDHIAAGATQTVNAVYTMTDGSGATDQATLVITVTGINDAPVAVADTNSGDPVTEAGVIAGDSTASGNVLANDTDADVPDTKTVTTVNGSGGNVGNPVGGTYGSVTIAANGAYTYTLSNADADTNALDQGVTVTEVFTYAMVDSSGISSSTTLTITITGTNDAAVITGTTTGSVTEAGGVLNGTPGTPTATGNLDHTDVDTGDADDVWQPVSAGTDSNGGYGTYAVTAAGVWTYTLDNVDSTVQGLNVGETLTDTVTVTAGDGTTQTVTITINGTNDAPVVSGAVTANATEDGSIVTLDPLANATDVDGDALVAVPVGPLPAGVSFVGASSTIDFTGYTLGSVVGQNGWTDASPSSPANAIVDVGLDRMLLLANDPTSGDFGGPYSPSLSFSVGETPTGADGDTLSFSFNFKAASSTPDGSRIEIDLGTEGRDDRYNFMAIEHTATGLRLVQNTPQADGVNWQNNSFNWETGNIQLGPDMDPNVEHTITVIFRAIDGSNNDIIEYYVDGVLVGTGSSFENFGEFHLAQPHSSAVREVTNILFRAGEPAGNGFPQDGPGGQRAGFYIDDLTMQAFDSRQLQFDPTNSAYDHLAAGQTENVTVNYNVVDGKGGVTPATAVITVTGINDTAVITGDDTGSATETNAVLTVTGDLDVADVDDGESVFVAQTNTDGTWGAFSIDTAGEWSYVTDNAQNQFSAGQTYVDSFTVASADGTTEVVTITITGTNDAAVITGTSTGSVVEAGGVLNGTPGTPQATGNLDHTDVDDNNADDVWQAAGGTASNGYGSYAVTSAGVWTYTLNNNHSSVQALNVGGTLTDTFTVATEDGTTQSVTVTINGTNDAAVITGTNSAALTETNAPQSATGDLDATDVDNSALFNAQTTPGTYGTFSIFSNGTWTYAMSSAHNEFVAGQTYTDTFTVSTADGTTETVTVTMTGTNDGPVAVDDNFSVSEDGSIIGGSVATNDSDPDSAEVYTLNSAAPTGLTFNADGTFNFVPSDPSYQSLAQGASQVVSVDYTVSDGSASDTATLTITVNGANDAAVVTGTSTGSVTEDGGVANGTPGTAVASGNLDHTDIDSNHADDVWQASSGASANGYGSYSVTSAGVWTYTLNNNHSAVEGIGAGGSLTDTFAVLTEDGTTQVVTVTINGANDAPVANDDTNAGTEDGPLVTGNVGANDTDVDLGSTHSYALNAPVAGLTLGSNGSYIFNTLHPAYQSLAQGATQTVVANYTITDDQGATDTATLTITVTGANDAPLANNDANATVEDSVLNGNVGSNDSDVDNGAVLTYTLDAPLTGLTLNSNGSYSFNAGNAVYQHIALGATQIVTANYTVTDQHGATDNATLTITIAGTNDAPVANNDSFSATEDGGTVTGTVATNDTDVDDGATRTYALIVPVAGLTLSSNGNYSFNPSNFAYQSIAAGDSQILVVGYRATDQHGANDTATITITVFGTNDGPIALNDTNSATEDGAVVTGSVATNDSDVDSGSTRTYALNAPVDGLALNSDGSYSFDPTQAAYQSVAAGTTQNVVATYTVTDDQGATDTATLTISVAGVNDAPVADDDSAPLAFEDGAVVTGDVSTNDTDIDAGTTLTYALSAPVAGLTLNPNGTYSFDPSDAAYQSLAQGAIENVVATYVVSDGQGGSDTATLTFTLFGANDGPVAVDDTASASEGGALVTGNVGTNDSDVDDGASLSYAPAGPLPAGLVFGPNGNYSFDPTDPAYNSLALGVTQNVVFTYSVSDEFGATDTGTLTITVTGTNDAPVANDDVNSATEDGAAATGNVGANDTDVDTGATRTYALNAPVAGLTLNPNGSYSFDPSNAAYQSLAQGATQNVVATYTATDQHGATDTATLTITVTGANDAPVANDDVASATEDGAVVTGNVGANDTDVDTGATRTYALNAPVAGLTLNPDGSYSFNPSNAAYQALAAGETQSVVATYTATDQHGASDTATLTITVTGANDAAVITGNTTGSATETNAVLTVTGNLDVTDVDGDDVFAVQNNTDGTYGSFTIDADGDWSYVTDDAVNQFAQGQTYVDTFTVASADGTTQSVAITITGSNDAPVANDDTASATEDGAVVLGSVATNDTDVDIGATRTFALDAPVSGLTLGSNGSYVFNPLHPAYQSLAQGATQNVVANYTVTDEHGATDNATLTITVTGTNDAPVANDDANTAVEGAAAATGNVGANDSDVDNGATRTYALSAPVAGLTFNPDGSYSFDPTNAAYDSLALGTTQTVVATYTATDQHGATDTATLTVTVIGTNDAPVANDDVNSATEDGAAATGNVGANDTDVDTGATRTYALNAPVAGLTLNPNGSYSFDPSNAAYQSLAQGATQNVVATYTATDQHGATDTATLTITVTGANDAPVANDDVASATEDGAVVTGNVGANDTDVDTGATRTYALAAPVAGLTLNPDGSYSFNPANVAYQSLAAGVTQSVVATYTATDQHGATDTATLTITVTGVDDAGVAQPDAFATNEATDVNGNVFANNGSGADADVDNPLTVAAVNGSALAVGNQITLASGALLTLNSNGTFNYDLNGAFDDTPAAGSGASNLTRTDSFNYTLAGGGTTTVTLTISGLDSNDTLLGTAGTDTLAGGNGDDRYFIENATDTVIEALNAGFDRVLTSVSWTLNAGSHVDMITTQDNDATTAINLTGNALFQYIYGNDGANEIDGAGGGDVMYGFAGDDRFYIRNVADRVVEFAAGGFDRVLAAASFTLEAGSEVEMFTTTDNLATTAINLTGNELSQYMYGNAGANEIDGGGGGDVMYGFEGDDRFYTHHVSDRVVESAGGGANDRVLAGASFTLEAGSQVEMLTTIDNLSTAAINLTGNELAQYMYGNAGANILDGKGGADVLTGFGGADSFAFTSALGGGNIDRIADFSAADDTILLDDAVFTGLALGALNPNAFVIRSDAGDADDRIIYNQATGQLFFDADGNGAGVAVHFASLDGAPLITASDFTVI